MKAILILTVSLFLASCATTSTPKKEVNKKVEDMMSEAWYQRAVRR